MVSLEERLAKLLNALENGQQLAVVAKPADKPVYRLQAGGGSRGWAIQATERNDGKAGGVFLRLECLVRRTPAGSKVTGEASVPNKDEALVRVAGLVMEAALGARSMRPRKRLRSSSEPSGA
jgi:hypothetical protein